MSKIGKKEIIIPPGVEIARTDGTLSVRGPKGSLSRYFRDEIEIKVNDQSLLLLPRRKDKFSRSLWGTYASHLRNMIAGVQSPFQKKLILEGIGFKSEVKGKELHLALGFSHPTVVAIPEGLSVTSEKNVITIAGIDKELVGSFAASLRALKKPEPYKGKGLRYEDEVIRRKQGKKTA
jgi:large subunit ribosomal protein L6